MHQGNREDEVVKITPESADRRAEVAGALDATRARIERARVAVGRTDPVTLVVVTKTFPAEDVDLLVDLGVTDVGENRDQEASAKRRAVGGDGTLLRWHMIGQVQRNKARSVIAWADVIESVDRPALAMALGSAAMAAGRHVDVLIQVNLDPAPQAGRGGALPDEVPALADLIAGQECLRLAGVMGVAPNPAGEASPRATARAAFDRLGLLSTALRRDHPQARVVSAGMSGDLEEAIAAGATQVRVGGAILGHRPPVQ